MRFPEFDGEWEKYNVSDILNTFPTNSLSWDNLSYKCGKIKNIHYGLIHNGFDTTCVYTTNKIIPFIKDGNFPLEYTLLKTGDLILADASENRKDVGRPIEIINDICENIISGLHTIHARDESNIAVQGFKGFYFQSKSMKSQIYRIANGSKIYGISPSNFKELHMCLPDHLEQEKIVVLLRKIETRIQTQSKIIKDLESVKNEISNRIFKLKLIEKSTKYLAEYLREGDKTPVNTFKYKKITIKLNKQGIVYSDINRDMADTRPFYIRHKDELIIGKQNYFNGSIAIVDEQYDNCICSNAIMSFNVVGINKEFLYFQLSNNNYLNSQSYKANGTGQKELSEKELLNFKIWCPSIEEQIKIVNCFKALDGKIKNEKAVLNSYMQEKDYLLTNMFI